jgi:uncharacterized UBP type Zn finger protein
MDAYDSTLAPAPFGLQNTGALCYFNSFLQLLAGCTAFTRQVLKNEKLMRLTVTGTATYQFCAAYATIADDGQIVARPQPTDNIAQLSSVVFEALLADVRARRPDFELELGRGQADARMVMEMFIDMLELTPDGDDSPGGAAVNAVTQLFRHEYDLTVSCRCGRVHKPPPEGKMAVFNLVSHLRRRFPETAQEFSSFIRKVAFWNDDYKCEDCKVRSKTITTYNLKTVPEILLCMFNLKTDQWPTHVHSVSGQLVQKNAGGARIARYFPARLEFPALGGGTIVFRLVGQAEHSGGNSSGHYWARGLRAGGSVHRLNDTGTSPDRFGPSPETYLIAYHYDNFVPNR